MKLLSKDCGSKRTVDVSDGSATESHGGSAGTDIASTSCASARGTAPATPRGSPATPRGSGISLEDPVRREIEVMAHAMEHKLRENDHKGGWELTSIDQLFELLIGEVDELREAIQGGNFIEIMLEAADVANYAMMIAWNSMKGKLK